MTNDLFHLQCKKFCNVKSITLQCLILGVPWSPASYMHNMIWWPGGKESNGWEGTSEWAVRCHLSWIYRRTSSPKHFPDTVSWRVCCSEEFDQTLSGRCFASFAKHGQVTLITFFANAKHVGPVRRMKRVVISAFLLVAEEYMQTC